MAKYMGKITRESIVEIVGKASVPDQEIKGCTNKDMENNDLTSLWPKHQKGSVWKCFQNLT